ncbi:MAG: STAS/SEC14 domain-containing protein, partial [Pusillimonas sp.]
MILYHTTPDSPAIEISVEGKITDHELREVIER